MASRRVGRASRGLWLMAGLLALAGCGLFTPAKPDPPDTGSATQLPILTIDPESALVSVVRGLRQKNQTLYLHGLADSAIMTDVAFHAFFDPQDLFDYQNQTGSLPPSDWRHDDEETFLPQFFPLRPVNYDVYFTPDPNRPDDLINPDQEVIFYRRYRIWAQAVPLAVGVADLRIQRVGVSGEWKIVHWVDARDTTAADVLTYGRRRLDAVR